jgi:hypothetical protein
MILHTFDNVGVYRYVLRGQLGGDILSCVTVVRPPSIHIVDLTKYHQSDIIPLEVGDLVLFSNNGMRKHERATSVIALLIQTVWVIR